MPQSPRQTAWPGRVPDGLNNPVFERDIEIYLPSGNSSDSYRRRHRVGTTEYAAPVCRSDDLPVKIKLFGNPPGKCHNQV
jgi:hypothetical protein